MSTTEHSMTFSRSFDLSFVIETLVSRVAREGGPFLVSRAVGMLSPAYPDVSREELVHELRQAAKRAGIPVPCKTTVSS